MKTPFRALKNLNPFVSSISQGQVINVPPNFGTFAPGSIQPGQIQGPVQPKQPRQQQYLGQGVFVPPQVARPNQGVQQYRAPIGPVQQQAGQNVYSGIQASPAALAYALTNAKNQNELPDIVSLADFNRTGLSLDKMLAAGYRVEGGNLILQQGNVGTQEQNFAQNMQTQANLMEQYRYDPKKKQYVKIKDLVRQGRLDLKTGRMYNQPMKRNRKGRLVYANRPEQEQQVAPSPLETVRTDTPSVTLDLILGS